MLRNYLTTALRHLLKHRAYAAINILGLAMGMACCLLILLDIQYELGFESFHRNAERIHRLRWGPLGEKAAPLARQLAEDIPEIEAVVRFRSFQPVLTRGENQFYQHITFAGEDVFDVFDFPLVRGDPSTALREPYSMVLSERVAHRLFGDEDPVGQSILWDNTFPYTITGVMHDVPRNTHYWMEVLGALKTVEIQPEFVHNRFYQTYVMLREGIATDEDGFAAKVLDFYRRRVGEVPAGVEAPRLQPVKEIHLDESLRTYLYSLAAIGGFILLVACVNFTNLATARAATRAREVGLRKAVGAHRGQLAWQFLGESLVMAFASLVLAVMTVWLVLPRYAAFSGKPLVFGLADNPLLVGGGLGIALVVGLLAGAYPALFLAGFGPAHALKGETGVGGRSSALRRGLVTFQFLVAAILVTATGIVYQQLDYVRAKDLGINREQVLTIWLHNQEVKDKLPILREGWLADPRVEALTVSSTLPAGGMPTGLYRVPGENEEKEARLLGVDGQFIDFYGFELLAGRHFEEYGYEQGVCIVNERFVRALGLTSPEHAIGASIHWRSPGWVFRNMESGETYQEKEGIVIGVVADVHYETLHRPIEPLILFPEISWRIMHSIRVAGGDVPGAMAHMRQVWDRTVPTLPFNPSFLDDAFAHAYRAEERLGKTIGTFASLAVFVTCLGVFGLASFTIARRTKEIGVRKSIGASTGGIVLLLSVEPVRLALLACVVAAPLTWYALDSWLQAFAYRVTLGPLVFVLGACVVFFVGWLAVAPVAARAARADPVQALRYE